MENTMKLFILKDKLYDKGEVIYCSPSLSLPQFHCRPFFVICWSSNHFFFYQITSYGLFDIAQIGYVHRLAFFFSVFFLLLFHSWLLNHDPKRIFNNVKLIFIRLKLASCQTKTYLVLKGPNTTKRFLLRFSEATRLCAFQYIYSSLNFTHN